MWLAALPWQCVNDAMVQRGVGSHHQGDEWGATKGNGNHDGQCKTLVAVSRKGGTTGSLEVGNCPASQANPHQPVVELEGALNQAIAYCSSHSIPPRLPPTLRHILHFSIRNSPFIDPPPIKHSAVAVLDTNIIPYTFVNTKTASMIDPMQALKHATPVPLPTTVPGNSVEYQEAGEVGKRTLWYACCTY